MSPLRVFVGADPRQPLAYSVCASSVLRHAGKRVTVEPIGLYDWVPGFTRMGLTSFSLIHTLLSPSSKPTKAIAALGISMLSALTDL